MAMLRARTRLLATALTVSRASSYGLHVKAGPDGLAVGDCPFAQAIRMAMRHKNIAPDLHAWTASNKPEWLTKGGGLPALVVGEDVIHESRTISKWLEQHHPDPSLSPPLLDAAEAAASPIFGAFARYCKNCDTDKDAELKMALMVALSSLDAHLSMAEKPYIAGSHLSSADCFLSPALYHMRVAGEAFKDFAVPEHLAYLCEYMDHMHSSELHVETAPPAAMIRWGWAQARGDDEAARAAAEECAAAVGV